MIVPDSLSKSQIQGAPGVIGPSGLPAICTDASMPV
jgi:hypothetical protein